MLYLTPFLTFFFNADLWPLLNRILCAFFNRILCHFWTKSCFPALQNGLTKCLYYPWTYADVSKSAESSSPWWINKMRTFPPSWLNKPANGERYESSANCLKRLNVYSFLEGCLFVTGRCRLDGTPKWQFLCKFHGLETANKRNLEDWVVNYPDLWIRLFPKYLGCQTINSLTQTLPCVLVRMNTNRVVEVDLGK